MNPNCNHKSLTDLTNGKGETRNFYCPQCDFHIWKGKEWTKEEWNKYVNDLSPESIYKSISLLGL